MSCQLKVKRLKRGDTWNPTVQVKENGSAKDCTGFDMDLIIKEELKETAPEIKNYSINWTDINNGIGDFTLAYADSKLLVPKDYYMEFKLYNSGPTIVKTLKQMILRISESLEKDV